MPCYYQAGEYRVRVIKQTWTETSNRNPMFVLDVTILAMIERRDEESTLSPVTQYDRKVRRVVTEKTVDRTLEELHRLGWRGRSFADLDPRTPGFYDFAGIEFDARCEIEEYQNKDHEQWSIGGGAPLEAQPMDVAGLRKMDTLYSKQLAAGASATPASTSEPTQSGATPDGGDGSDKDLPF